MKTIEGIRFALGIIGNITEILISLAPIPTFWRIWRKRSIEKFSWLPYISGLLYATFWGCYSLPFVSKHNMLLLIVSAVQGALELCYLVLYIAFSPSKEKVMVSSAVIAVALSFGGTILIAKIPMHEMNEREFFVGVMAAFVTIAMYAAPLSVVKLVIQTRSVEYMPFLLSFSNFTNSIVWTIYGVLGRDLFITISEGLGTLLGGVQLILYFAYRPRGKITIEQDEQKSSQIVIEILAKDDIEKHNKIILGDILNIS